MKFISLFSGAGGLDLGFEQAGFHPVVAYDSKVSAINTYNHNRNANIALQADLSKIDAADIIREIKKRNGFEHILGVVGGPPCQYFSFGNRSKKIDDPRRLLPQTYAKILTDLNTEFKLDFFIFENVFGLASKVHAGDLEEIKKMLDNAGFHTTEAILDAHDYGVPQTRCRIFIIGWNKDKYPKDDYSFPPSKSKKLNVKDAIWELQEPIYYKRNLDSSTFPIHPNHWTMNPKSPKFNNLPHPDIKNGSRSFKRLSWDKPSFTVAYGHNEIHVHPEGHRRLSIYEAMLLQGFPKSGYELIGHLSEQVSLVSDAVPPPLANILAKSIKSYIEKNSYVYKGT